MYTFADYNMSASCQPVNLLTQLLSIRIQGPVSIVGGPAYIHVWTMATIWLLFLLVAASIAQEEEEEITIENLREHEDELYEKLIGDEPIIEGESLYDRLNRIQIHSEDEKSKLQRVTFNSGGGGVKRDDLLVSNDQEEWLFGGNEPWELRNHSAHEPQWDNTAIQDDSFDPDFWNNTEDYLSGVPQPEIPEHLRRRKRAGFLLHKSIKPWKNGNVPYYINPNHFDEEERNQLKEAMRVYEEQTCLRFVQRTNEKQWINIHHTDDGCYSLLGDASRHNPGPQPISLQKPGCRNIGTYLHEMGHAVGMVHEHQLPTRDMFVRYYLSNIDPLNVEQLEMYNPRIINTFSTPYDLGSIMHYELTSFSIDSMSPTLGADNQWLMKEIGRRYSPMLSFGDVKTLNELYNCGSKCGSVRCPENLGFVNKNCECVTYQSYMQKECRDEEGMEGYCNKITPTGRCNIRNIDHHNSCRKTCGFCPRFKPGDSAIGPQQLVLGRHKCINRYHNPQMCNMWAQYCPKSAWMHRYCRATCKACQSKVGDCPNYDNDDSCDHRAKKGYCGTKTEDRNPKEFMKVRCRDSCETCGRRNEDLTCRNVKSDTECRELAQEDGCEKNPLPMFLQCPSTCNRCYWQKGSCSNKMGDQQCAKMALNNWCIAGGKKMLDMRKVCPKMCDVC